MHFESCNTIVEPWNEEETQRLRDWGTEGLRDWGITISNEQLTINNFLRSECRAKLAWAMPSDDRKCSEAELTSWTFERRSHWTIVELLNGT